MLSESETVICSSIGAFSTIPQVINPKQNSQYAFVDSYTLNQRLPGQCRAFLASAYEFTWFIEEWSVVLAPAGSAPETPKATLENKKVYPAKVTGIGLPYLLTETITWREGLINSFIFDNTLSFRPGFGQVILNDLSRPLKSVLVQRNDLGLGQSAQAAYNNFCGPLGRLMSIATYIDPELASKYDASQKSKKNKSLNPHDSQQMPTHPLYDLYTPSTGY